MRPGVAPAGRRRRSRCTSRTDGDDEALADRLDRYDMLTPPAARRPAIGLWRLDPAYLDSIAALAGEAVR